MLTGMGLAIFCLAIVSLSQAESYKGRWELGIQGGGILVEGNSALDDHGVFGGRVGYGLTEKLGLEAAILAGETEVRQQSGDGTTNSDQDADVIIPTAEILYHFGQSSIRPFLAAGVGDYHTKPAGASKNDDFILQYGAGVKWLFAKSFIARIDARHIVNTEYSYDFLGKSKNLGSLTAGLSWLFGAKSEPKEEPKAVVAAAPQPVDSDRDGIMDDKDACPGTPAGTKVDARGCPVVVDSDGDGVPDDKDECPGTPAGTAVDATGCPQTVKAIEDNWVLKGVTFETGSNKIKAGSLAILDEAAEILKARNKVRVEIQGHTDSVGKAESNMALSETRAASVKDYLVKKGVNPSQLETKGFGATQPIGDNNTAEGRAQNRRIEFKVLSR